MLIVDGILILWLVTVVRSIEVLNSVPVSCQVVKVLISENVLVLLIGETPVVASSLLNFVEFGSLVDLEALLIGAVVDLVVVDVCSLKVFGGILFFSIVMQHLKASKVVI